MAILLECFSLLIPWASIEKHVPGGERRIREQFSDHPGIWWDKHLFRCGAMNQLDLLFWVQHWEGQGLKRFRRKKGRRVVGDIAIVANVGQPKEHCEWLEVDPEKGIAWLKGADPGEISGPGMRRALE